LHVVFFTMVLIGKWNQLQKSLRHIEKLNGLRSSQESAYYGLTEFSDLSKDEFLQQTLLPDLPLRSKFYLREIVIN